MKAKKLKADRLLRAKLRSPGRPPVLHRAERWPFWKAIAQGHTSEDAAGIAGVSPAVGNRWFRQCGGCLHRILPRPRQRQQADTFPFLSANRSRWHALAAKVFGRLRVSSIDRHRRSRASFGAMQPRAAAAQSTGPTRRNGMPTAQQCGPSRPNSLRIRCCARTSRIDWPGTSRPRAGERSRGHRCRGRGGDMDAGKSAGGHRPGARNRLHIAC